MIGIVLYLQEQVRQKDLGQGGLCQLWVMMRFIQHDLIISNHLVDIGSSSPCKGKVGIIKEISTKMVDWWANSFELIVVDMGGIINYQKRLIDPSQTS